MTDPTPADPRPEGRTRHDAFDGKRKRAFLDAFGKSGCLRDAARRVGVSHQTVYNHQRSDRAFARQCELALDMAGTDVELHAWERGVVGVEEPVYYRGEIVGTRLKRSDAVLRLLLQATKPRKYGPNPGFTRKRLAKAERRTIEREVRAEWAERNSVSPEETDRAILTKLDAIARQRMLRHAPEASTGTGDARWTPPAPTRADADAGAALRWPDNRAEQRPDSV